ncbi:conserved hypothetical protein [Pyrobaculum aerophilum str. IM2]|uniref:DUF996 domain-containing protein n=2 Tax=Pyrobaculum aerophilum TaxID=13773 RepID=Q8ZXS3_PYRAE|nr:DUF996 domain-containing protein [Pyrobaculum aerophilum]AAL63273.1 conserved hypothetical protein [Pyrobaculum aerophilum str. IM2]HII47883.1 DUF996 domain-containing protein [Pyrobaculum aerophilum]
MDFETSKILFAVGLILQLIGTFTVFVDLGVVSLVGWVLLLVGAHGLSDYYGNREIFNNYLYAFIAGLVGMVVLVVAFAGWLMHTAIFNPFALPRDFWSWVYIFVAVWFLTWVIIIISAYFEKRALEALHKATGVGDFGKAATFVWIGALLAVILVGLIIIVIGLIFAIIAAFGLKPKEGS